MSCRNLAVSTVVLTLFVSLPRVRAAQPGFVEDFNGGNLGEFVSFAPLELVPTGGVGGAGDAYLRTSREFPDRLGAHSELAEFVGNLIADGVGGYSFWLNDLGSNDGVEVHVGVGAGAFDPEGPNFWQSINGFTPPTDGWQEFSVDFSDASQWVQIIGTGTFADALKRTEKVLFRHDFAPFEQEPNIAAGDYGIDRITVLAAAGDGPSAVPEGSPAAVVTTAMLVLVVGVLALRRRQASFG